MQKWYQINAKSCIAEERVYKLLENLMTGIQYIFAINQIGCQSNVFLISLFINFYFLNQQNEQFIFAIFWRPAGATREREARGNKVPQQSYGVLLYTDRVTSPLINGESFIFPLIQTELSPRWSTASFWCSFYIDRVTSLLITGEFSIVIFIQTQLPRRWSPAKFQWCFSLYRQSYLAVHHRRASFSFPLYTDRVTSPLINGEFFIFPFIQTELSAELSRRWSLAKFWCLHFYRQSYLAVYHWRDNRSVYKWNILYWINFT